MLNKSSNAAATSSVFLESVSQETLSTPKEETTTTSHDMGGSVETKSDSKKTDDVAAAFDDLFNN